MSTIILISLFVVFVTIIGIRFLDVKISNIELVDRGLYTIITDRGPVNVGPEDILRIERTYTKAAITGAPVELDKIYTTKGFIYLSSLDAFYETGHQLINSVDFEGKPVWIRPVNTDATKSETLNQRLNANMQAVQPFSYAIGTPTQLVPVIFSILSLQYLALTLGGLALSILIFPLRLETPIPAHAIVQQETENRSTEEQLCAVAK